VSTLELDDAVTAVASLPDAAERTALAQLARQRGYFFAALRCVIDAPALLRPLLADVQAGVPAAAAPGAPHGAWLWAGADRDALCGQYGTLPAVREYSAVAPALRACGEPGAAAAARLEADLLQRVCADFDAQLNPHAPAAPPAGAEQASHEGGGDDAAAAASSASGVRAAVQRIEARALLASAQAEHAAASAASAAASAEERRVAKAAAAAAATASANATATAAEASAALSAAAPNVSPTRRPTRASSPSHGAPAGPPSAPAARVAAARRAAQLEADARRAAEAVTALERQKSALAAKLAAERARADAAVARLAAAAPAPAGAPPPNGRPRRASTHRASDDTTPATPPTDASAAASTASASASGDDGGAFVAQHNAPVDTAPTEEEIAEYAVFLGMDPDADQSLFYIAAWALTAPLPDGWSEHVDADGNEYFFHERTGVSTYAHPLDELYRSYWRGIKGGTIGAAPAAAAAEEGGA
jgi:hypothetical protein